MEKIEVLDIDENKNKNDNTKIKTRTNKKKKLKVRSIQILFCLVSFLFIVGCCIFYGIRLIKYYRIYNPKAENGETITLLSNTISGHSEIVYEGSGLYIDSGNYIYKGDVTNNYLFYNNLLWRIVRINQDGTLEIILDDYINLLEWNTKIDSFTNASINKYLNEYFYQQLDSTYLANSSYCTDKISSLTTITCNIKNNDYFVKLMDITNFLNSVVSGKTYLTNDEEIMWLSDYSDDTVWHTNGYNISKSMPSKFYEIRPVVTLKASSVMYGGTGTVDDPYLIEKGDNTLKFGSYLSIDNDLWQVYETNDSFIKLVLSDNLEKQYRFDKESNKYDINSKLSLAYYLNNTYLDSLAYKDLLQETTWSNGLYENNYLSIEDSSVKAKVGVLTIKDIKLNSSIKDYYLMNGNSKGYVYVYSDILKTSKPTLSRNIRPCIVLNKDITINSGDGSSDSPFVVGGIE